MKKIYKLIIICTGIFLFPGFQIRTVIAEEVVEEVQEEMYLFVREGCPHCLDTEEFIEKYSLSEYVVILDVDADPKNAELYNTKFDDASVPLQDRGSTPVMFEGLSYFLGSDQIIYQLGEKFGIDTGIEPDENSEKEKNSKVIVIIFATALFASAGFLFLNKKNEK